MPKSHKRLHERSCAKSRKRSNKRNVWFWLVVAGSVLLTAALLVCAGTFALRAWVSSSAQTAISAIEEILPTEDEKPPASYPNIPEMDMPTTEVDGVRFVGVLNNVSEGTKFPVAQVASWCMPYVQAGSAYDESGYVVALTTWADMGGIRVGSIIQFSDVDGNVFSYEVVEFVELGEDKTDFDTDSWGLTLHRLADNVAIHCKSA